MGGQFHSNYYFPPLKKLSNIFAHLSQIETNSQVEPQGPFAVSCFDSNLSSLLPNFLVFLGSGSLVNYMDSILILIKCFPGSPLWTPASPCLLDSGTEKKMFKEKKALKSKQLSQFHFSSKTATEALAMNRFSHLSEFPFPVSTASG